MSKQVRLFLLAGILGILLIPFDSYSQNYGNSGGGNYGNSGGGNRDKPNLSGVWKKNPPDCVIEITDNGRYVTATCNTDCCHHKFSGEWVEDNLVVGSITRIDAEGCTLRVPEKLSIVDEDTIRASQKGWRGCGVETPKRLYKN